MLSYLDQTQNLSFSISTLKELGHDLTQNFNFVFPLLMSRMVNIGIVPVSSKFESLILSYKRVTEVRNLCSVNKARVLLMLTYLLYWYEIQSNVAVCCYQIFYEPSEPFYLFSKLF